MSKSTCELRAELFFIDILPILTKNNFATKPKFHLNSFRDIEDEISLWT